MTTQLIRHLERRSEKYSGEGANTEQTLLLLDEFPRIGKVQCMADAMATLRSKGVNICLAIQSIAQLDAVYGIQQRRVIMDNCQFQLVLRANDSETQRLLSDLIGTAIVCRRSAGVSYDEFKRPTGYHLQMGESREHIIQPHELATLNDALVISPYGAFRVEKYQQYEHLRFEDSNAFKRYNFFKPITLTEVKRK